MSEKMVEKLSEYAHLTWSGWMHYMFDKSTKNDDGSVTIPPDLVERWTRQAATSYSELPESEKASDRKEAKAIISITESLPWAG